MSRAYAAPFKLVLDGNAYPVAYEPGESRSGMIGGNSNWRGPVWFPINYLLIESLRQFHRYYGDDFAVECPTGSGQCLTLNQIADELSRRLISLFLRDKNGRRPVFGYDASFLDRQDGILFHEYFNGEDGRGCGAGHQSWTALVATLIGQTSAAWP